MKAIRFNPTTPRYILGLGLRKIYQPALWSGISCTYSEEVPEPELPGEDWAIIRTTYGGVCGSDISTIHLDTSPYFEPYSSFPFTFGHENCGVIEKIGHEVHGFEEGARVVVEPTLWCMPRGFSDLCRYCQRGQINRCLRRLEGNLAPAVSIGFSRDTGGSWSQYFLAHQSQLYQIPDGLDDENALMVEPFATGLHAALVDTPGEDETVLIVGAGTIGLVTLAGLRAIGCKSKILVVVRYPFQGEAARKLGATEIIQADRDVDFLETISRQVGGKIVKPRIGKRVVIGGVDRTYDCVGSSSSLIDSLRLTREGGRVILVGVPGNSRGAEWPVTFMKELHVQGTYVYDHAETYESKRWKTFDLAITLLANGRFDLGWMVTHRFPVQEFDRVFRLQNSRAGHEVIKTVFDFREIS